jgi:hypothetical protein
MLLALGTPGSTSTKHSIEPLATAVNTGTCSVEMPRFFAGYAKTPILTAGGPIAGFALLRDPCKPVFA